MTLDQAAFRQALGSFATGVTIVTTCDEAAQPIGVTASSFNSVSLDPPLVLWSLAKSARSHDVFRSSGHFAIHVLAADQEDLSNGFARSGEDKFADIDWQSGELGSPVLDHYAALFECRTMHQYEGGDHVILVGEVVAYDRQEKQPLLFHGGRYAETRDRGSAEEARRQTVDTDHGSFTDDFLLYLLSRAHFQASRPTRQKLQSLGISQIEYMTLALLSLDAPADAQAIADRLDHTGFVPSESELAEMATRGLLTATGAGYEPAEQGRACLIETLSVAKAFETDLVDHFTPGEIAEAKRLLKKIIDLTGDDIPIAWRSGEGLS